MKELSLENNVCDYDIGEKENNTLLTVIKTSCW